MTGLRKMFDHCMENSFIPKVIVLCGNFSSRGIAQGSAREIRRYQGPQLSPYINARNRLIFSPR